MTRPINLGIRWTSFDRLSWGILALILLAHGAQARFTRAETREFEQLCRPAVEKQGTIGMAVGVRLGDSIWTAGFGSTGPGGKTPDVSTLFEIGSLTKIFTGVLLADLADRRVVALDDSIAKYLPSGVNSPAAFGFRISLLQLITHRSGLPSLPSNIRPRDPSDPFADYAAEQLYQFLNTHQLRHAPDSHFEYSNLGAGLLGHLLSRAAGKPYETLLQERIFLPLGMKSTQVQITGAALPLAKRMATPHDVNKQPVRPLSFGVLAGCGAIRSSVDDMLRFIDANLGLLDLGSDAERWSRVFAECQRTHGERTGPDMGLAWRIHGGPGPHLWHNGGTAGSWSWIGLNKEKKLGVIVLTNSARPIDDVGSGLMKKLWQMVEAGR